MFSSDDGAVRPLAYVYVVLRLYPILCTRIGFKHKILAAARHVLKMEKSVTLNVLGELANVEL